MTIDITQEQVRWFRLRRSGLVAPFPSPAAAAAALAGVQAQILPAAALAIWNRTRGLTYAAFQQLLYEERRLVKLWGQRHTLHLFPAEDWPLICAALAPRETWWERGHAQAGTALDEREALVREVVELLRARGVLARSDLRFAGLPLRDHDLSAWGGIFSELVRRGIACHADPAGSEARIVHRESWLPALPWEPPAPAYANVELARRYLRAYGPATVQDLAYWRGARVGDARGWIEALADEVIEVAVDDRRHLALRDDLSALVDEPLPSPWPVRLLYRFDPLLLAHRDKSWIVDPAHYNRVWRPAGHIEGTLLRDGQIAGTWRYDRKGGGLAISLHPFQELSPDTLAAVERTAEEVARFFDLPLTALRIGAASES